MIRIHKVVGNKIDAIRINKRNDIPKFLKNNIKIKRGNVLVKGIIGEVIAPLSCVVGYEKSLTSSTGWNTWVIENSNEYIELVGEFYNKPTIYDASIINEEIPDFIKGADIRRNDDGSWTIKTEFGPKTEFPYEGYWICYGVNSDGTPNANIIKKTDEVYQKFIVCDKNDKDIDFLSYLDI